MSLCVTMISMTAKIDLYEADECVQGSSGQPVTLWRGAHLSNSKHSNIWLLKPISLKICWNRVTTLLCNKDIWFAVSSHMMVSSFLKSIFLLNLKHFVQSPPEVSEDQDIRAPYVLINLQSIKQAIGASFTTNYAPTFLHSFHLSALSQTRSRLLSVWAENSIAIYN